ncbi:MAG: FecR family protein [Elusimicrobiota bacterium]
MAILQLIEGRVQVKRLGRNEWEPMISARSQLNIGDQVRTSSRAKAVLIMPDRSKIELGPSSLFVVDALAEDNYSFKLNLGRLKAFASKLMSRRFAVMTPTAVAAVRGTEFTVDVDRKGISRIELFSGLLAVSDNKGNEMMLRPGERIEVTHEMMGAPGQGQKSSKNPASLKDVAKKEVASDMTKEQVQAAAAQEMKLAEYQLGKAMIDAFGQRVRLEEYVFKPAPDQAKFVALNERDDRFDYFYYLGTFNKELPSDVGKALLQLGGGMTLPDYYLTGYESYRSNTTDNMKELASGGHLVDLGPAGTGEAAQAFDANQGKTISLVSGDHYYKTFFDSYALSVNGNNKITLDASALSLSGSGDFKGRVQSLAHEDASWRYAGGGVFTEVKGPGDYNGDMHFAINNTFNDGTFLNYSMYMVRDDGSLLNLKDFNNVSSGEKLKELMMSWNYEEVTTATEFQGRKIDLSVDPKIFIQMGQANVQ